MRLKDIEVDEVSLVDKAANKRKFAFLKRDDSKENKEAEKAAEVKEAEKLINKEVPPTEPTAEEIKQIQDLLAQVKELQALVKKA